MTLAMVAKVSRSVQRAQWARFTAGSEVSAESLPAQGQTTLVVKVRGSARLGSASILTQRCA